MPAEPLVVLCVDETFLTTACVASWSLLNAARERIHLRVIDCGLTARGKEALRRVVDSFEGHDLAFLPMPQPLAGDNMIPLHLKATLARLFIPDLLPEASRAIYMDVDTLVCDDISKLATTDLEGHPVGAVRNLRSLEKFYTARCSVMSRLRPHLRAEACEEAAELRGALGITPTDYINAGVLLFDLDAIRADTQDVANLKDFKAAAEMRRFDQDWISKVFAGRIHHLHPRWNSYSTSGRACLWSFDEPDRTLIREAMRDPAIVHFVGRKPWQARFRDYLRTGGLWLHAWQRIKRTHVDPILAAA